MHTEFKETLNYFLVIDDDDILLFDFSTQYGWRMFSAKWQEMDIRS